MGSEEDDEVIVLDGIHVLASEEELLMDLRQQTKRKDTITGKRTRGATSGKSIGGDSYPPPKKKPQRDQRLKRIEQLHPTTGEVVAQYNSIKEGAAAVGVCSTNISASLTSYRAHRQTKAGGYKWRFFKGSDDGRSRSDARKEDEEEDERWKPTTVANALRKRSTVRSFEESLKALIDYKQKHGHTNVPQQTGGRLGRFVDNMRQKHRACLNGKDVRGAPLKAKVISELKDCFGRLEEIGFQWTRPMQHSQHWEMRVAELQSYKEKHGDCDVKRRDGPLGQWVYNIRQRYGRFVDRSILADQMRQKLEQLDNMGFAWAPRRGRARKNDSVTRNKAESEDPDMYGGAICI